MKFLKNQAPPLLLQNSSVTSHLLHAIFVSYSAANIQLSTGENNTYKYLFKTFSPTELHQLLIRRLLHAELVSCNVCETRQLPDNFCTQSSSVFWRFLQHETSWNSTKKGRNFFRAGFQFVKLAIFFNFSWFFFYLFTVCLIFIRNLSEIIEAYNIDIFFHLLA